MTMFRAQNEPDVTAPVVFWGFKRDDVLVMQYVDGKPLWDATERPEPDRRDLAQRLARNFLKQVFVNNLYHADPHPGNVFLRGTEIVYLDMGAMGRIDGRTRSHLQALFDAVAQRDVEGATDALLNLGESSRADRSALLTDVGLIIASYGAATGERWSDRIVETARTHQIRLPRPVILLAKALVLIESLALRLDPEFSLDSVMREFVRELSAAEIREAMVHARRTAKDYLALIERLPSLVERALAGQAVAS